MATGALGACVFLRHADLTVSCAKGKTRQVYVSKDLQPLAQKWVRNYHQAMTVLEEISSINLELIRLKEPATDP